MRISRLTSTGIKGQEIDRELAPVHVLVGKNGTGKTAHLQAVEFALTGQVHGDQVGLGRKPSALMALHGSCSGAIDVTLEIEPSVQPIRRLVEGSTRSASQTIKPDGAPSIFGAMLDCRALLEQSATKLRVWLFGLVGDPSVSVEDARNYLLQRAGTFAPEPATVPVHSLAIEELTGDPSRWRGLEHARTQLDLDFKDANASASAATKAVEELALAALASAKAPPAGNLQELRAALVEAEKELRALDERLARHDESEKAGRAAREERDRLGQHVRQIGADLKALAAELKGAITKAADLRDLDQATQTIESARRDDKDCADLVTAAERTQASMAGELERRRQVHETTLTLGAVCPSCRAEMDDEYRQELQAETAAEVDEQIERVDAADAGLACATEARRKTAERLEAALAASDAYNRALDLQRAMDVKAADEEAARARLERLEATIAGLPMVDAEADALARQALVGSVERCRGRIESAQRAAGAGDALKDARGRAARTKERLQVVKDLRAWLGPQGLQGDMLRKQVGPFCERVDALMGGAGGFAVRLDGDGFDMGLQGGGAFVSYRTLSGGELAQLLSSVMAAAIEAADPEFRLLMVDNLQDVSEPARSALVERLCGLVRDDVLHQVLVGTSEPIQPEDTDVDGQPLLRVEELAVPVPA